MNFFDSNLATMLLTMVFFGGWLSRSKVTKCAAYGVAIMNGQRYGFININDMYNNDVGNEGAQGCEAYEVK